MKRKIFGQVSCFSKARSLYGKRAAELLTKKNTFFVKVLLLLMCCIVFGFGVSKAEKVLNIGIATPLTGPTAYVGENISNTVQLAIDDQNKQGGVTIAGEKYTLKAIIRDTKMDASIAKTIAEELIFNKKVILIVGPFIADAIGIQRISEPNKVNCIYTVPAIPGLCAPDKPFSFFAGSLPVQAFNNQIAYVNKYYPDLKTVATIAPDVPDTPLWITAAEQVCPKFGLKWLGIEKFPMSTVDYTPIVSRVLAKKPDIIDTSSCGAVTGNSFTLLIKTIRQVGYKGLIVVPAPPPDGLLESALKKEELDKIVTGNMNVDSPIIPKEYRDLTKRYIAKYNKIPSSGLLAEFYNATKPFLEFLDGQDTMNSEIWMEKFSQYKWKTVFGTEGEYIGKPVFGINRIAARPYHVSEFIDGKLDTRFIAPILDEFKEK